MPPAPPAPAPPKLPIPDLGRTMGRYLEVVRTLVDPAGYEETRRLTEAFLRPGACGERLQAFLRRRQEQEENWVGEPCLPAPPQPRSQAYEWWLEDMYLRNRASLPVHSSPGMVLESRAGPTAASWAAAMIRRLLSFQESIQSDALPQEHSTGRGGRQPLCMEQYRRLFVTCRIPGDDRDHLEEGETPGDHIIVGRRNQFFKVPLRVGGRAVGEKQVASMLEEVKRRAGREAPYPSVGLLTTERRDLWARARGMLLSDPDNKASLEDIESSLFLVCLDESAGGGGAGDDIERALQALHGGGTRRNGGNRWYDKTIQVILADDGACSLCYEHSPAEGVVVVQMMEKILSSGVGADSRDGESLDCAGSPAVERLHWNVDDELLERINSAGDNLERVCEDVDLCVLRYGGYGKEFVKGSRCSPDAFVQLALQLAHYRLHQELVPTYESASTRRFRLGRVDCIRSTTDESRRFVVAMCDEGTPTREKLVLLREAMSKQEEIMNENISGQGIDIHLLGLREAAKCLGEQTPEVFRDASFQLVNRFRLSTSQVTTTGESFMCYGPVVPDGYGVCYNLKGNRMLFSICCFKSCEFTSSDNFSKQLQGTLDELKELLSADPDTA